MCAYVKGLTMQKNITSKIQSLQKKVTQINNHQSASNDQLYNNIHMKKEKSIFVKHLELFLFLFQFQFTYICLVFQFNFNSYVRSYFCSVPFLNP